MKNTTLCYITRGDQVLMLHRVKKKNDINHDKWIGIGGKFEGEESPDECLLREVDAREGALTLKTLAVKGSDLMALGIAPGREIGRILNELLARVLAGELPNERNALLEHVQTPEM